MKDGEESNLEDLLRAQKINKTLLFLAVEQGSGKANYDVQVVLNLRVKNKAK